MRARKFNCQQARWFLKLPDYDFVLKCHPASPNKRADLLSRWKEHKEGVKDDNTGVTVLKRELFRAIAVYLRGPGEELMKRIRKSRKIEDKVREKVERKEKDWEEEDNIITWEGWIYVSKDKDLRDEVIHLHHDVRATSARLWNITQC